MTDSFVVRVDRRRRQAAGGSRFLKICSTNEGSLYGLFAWFDLKLPWNVTR
jgi:hypothetical protein